MIYPKSIATLIEQFQKFPSVGPKSAQRMAFQILKMPHSEVEKFANDMIDQELIVSTEIMPIDKAKEMGAMALFSEKYGETVRVVKIGKSIELCGGTHATNTKDIVRLAITSCESKGSNVYRIEAVTNERIEPALLEIISPYNDEKVKLLMKAKELIEDARNEGIKLVFDVDIDNNKPESYKDIMFNKNELQYLQQEVRELEKKYFESNDINRYFKKTYYFDMQGIDRKNVFKIIDK